MWHLQTHSTALIFWVFSSVCSYTLFLQKIYKISSGFHGAMIKAWHCRIHRFLLHHYNLLFAVFLLPYRHVCNLIWQYNTYCVVVVLWKIHLCIWHLAIFSFVKPSVILSWFISLKYNSLHYSSQNCTYINTLSSANIFAANCMLVRPSICFVL
jgi:hypothetical protein